MSTIPYANRLVCRNLIQSAKGIERGAANYLLSQLTDEQIQAVLDADKATPDPAKKPAAILAACESVPVASASDQSEPTGSDTSASGLAPEPAEPATPAAATDPEPATEPAEEAPAEDPTDVEPADEATDEPEPATTKRKRR